MQPEHADWEHLVSHDASRSVAQRASHGPGGGGVLGGAGAGRGSKHHGKQPSKFHGAFVLPSIE